MSPVIHLLSASPSNNCNLSGIKYFKPRTK